jgi:hypothetical protein
MTRLDEVGPDSDLLCDVGIELWLIIPPELGGKVMVTAYLVMVWRCDATGQFQVCMAWRYRSKAVAETSAAYWRHRGYHTGVEELHRRTLDLRRRIIRMARVRDERESPPSPPELIRYPLTRAEPKKQVEEEVANDPGVLLRRRFLQPLAMHLTPRQAAKLRLSSQ